MQGFALRRVRNRPVTGTFNNNRQASHLIMRIAATQVRALTPPHLWRAGSEGIEQ
jgi:hypothetical protein